MYAAYIFTKPYFMGFHSFLNVNFGSPRDNSTEYRKRATNPENPVFSGFVYAQKIYQTPSKHTKTVIACAAS